MQGNRAELMAYVCWTGGNAHNASKQKCDPCVEALEQGCCLSKPSYKNAQLKPWRLCNFEKLPAGLTSSNLVAVFSWGVLGGLNAEAP